MLTALPQMPSSIPQAQETLLHQRKQSFDSNGDKCWQSPCLRRTTLQKRNSISIRPFKKYTTCTGKDTHIVTVETAKCSQTECTWVASTVISSQNLLLPQTAVWLLMVQNGLLCVQIFNERHHLGWTLLLLTSFNQYYIYYPSILLHIRWDILRNALVQWVYTNWFLTSLLVVIWQWTLGRGRAASKGSKKIAGNREVVMLTKVIIAEEKCNDWIPDRVCV